MELTPTEQKIYRHFYSQKIFSIEDTIKFLKNNYRAALVSTKNLVSKKYVKKVRRGLYFIIPFEESGSWYKDFKPNKYLIANSLVEGFLSHCTALELHGVSTKILEKAYVCSSSKIPDVTISPFKFYVIKTKHYFGATEIIHKGVKLNISDKERTIIDCLRNVNYAYSLDDMIISLSKFENIDFEKLFDYLKKINEVSLYSRVGYVMDLLKFKLLTPDWFRSKVTKKLTERTYYLDVTKKGSSRHVKEWKLMVPEIIFKMNV